MKEPDESGLGAVRGMIFALAIVAPFWFVVCLFILYLVVKH